MFKRRGMNIPAGSNYQTRHPECENPVPHCTTGFGFFFLNKRKEKKLTEGRKEKENKIKFWREADNSFRLKENT
jgi:hypothetical protein